MPRVSCRDVAMSRVEEVGRECAENVDRVGRVTYLPIRHSWDGVTEMPDTNSG